MRLSTSTIALLTPAIMVAALACGDARHNPGDLRDIGMTITFTDDLVADVARVDAALWDVSDGGIAVGTELGRATATSVSESSTFVRFFVSASVASVDAECTAYNSLDEAIGHGVTLNAALGSGQTEIACAIVANSEGGKPVRLDISLDDSHHYDQVIVSPEPIDCASGDDVDYDVVVSDPQDDTFTLYATGSADDVTMPGQAQVPLSGIVSLASQAASSSGTAYTVSFQYDSAVVADTPTNIWAIDPGTGRGQVVRNSTLCSGSGAHDLAALPVAYFYDGTTFTFDVTYSSDGADLDWSCDNDLDGAMDETGTVSDRDLLGVVVTGGDTFDLIVTDGNEAGPTVTKTSVDCSP